MIDYEANAEKLRKEREDFVAIVSEIEDGLFEILIRYIKGEYDLQQARRKVLNKAFLLHHYMKENFSNKEYTSIKNNSLRSYSKMSYHIECKKARELITAIENEIEQREKEDSIDMRKNSDEIIIPNVPDDYVEESYGPKYQFRLEEALKEMANLVKEGYQIVWNPNNRWCKINGKVFNVHKNIWDLRKNEFL